MRASPDSIEFSPRPKAPPAACVRARARLTSPLRTIAGDAMTDVTHADEANEWRLPWHGGCRCDRVRIRVTAPPLVTMACHCTGCQRMTASAFSLSVLLLSEGLTVVQGEPVIGGLHGDQRHFFCPHCKSWM